MKYKRSRLWELSYSDLDELKQNSVNLSEICEKLNINPHNGSVKTLYKVAKSLNFDLKYPKQIRRGVLSPNDVFIEDSNANRNTIKKLLIKNNIIPYECKKCSNIGIWNDERLSLQLEHINGVNTDNRIENLCWLCPNCHSQTITYAGRNKKKNINISKFETEEERIKRIESTRKFHINRDDLERLLKNKVPFTTIAKQYNVSDNAIRKRARYFKLI